MHTYLCQDDTDQLIPPQGEIGIVDGMLLSSNVIHICVRVVMLVRMIQTHLFTVARVKSCPGMQSSWAIASLSGCARTVGCLPISGGGPGTDKRKLLAP